MATCLRTDKHTIKPPTDGVQLVGHTSTIVSKYSIMVVTTKQRVVFNLSPCSDGSRLSCCDVDHRAPQIPPLCHSGCFTNVCPRPFLYVSLPGSCWSPSASIPCSDPLDDGLFQAVVSDDVTKM